MKQTLITSSTAPCLWVVYVVEIAVFCLGFSSSAYAQETDEYGCRTYSFSERHDETNTSDLQEACEIVRFDWVENQNADPTKNGLFDDTDEDIDLCFVCSSTTPVLRLTQALELMRERAPQILATVQVLSTGDTLELSGQDQGNVWLFQYESTFSLEPNQSEVLKTWVTVEYSDGQVISGESAPLYILLIRPAVPARAKPDVASCSNSSYAPRPPSSTLYLIPILFIFSRTRRRVSPQNHKRTKR